QSASVSDCSCIGPMMPGSGIGCAVCGASFGSSSATRGTGVAVMVYGKPLAPEASQTTAQYGSPGTGFTASVDEKPIRSAQSPLDGTSAIFGFNVFAGVATFSTVVTTTPASTPV